MKIVLSILLFCTVLLADRDGGPYLGLGYGVSQYDDDSIYKEQTISESTALVLYGGAYINKHLSVELAYVDCNNGDRYKVINEQEEENFLSFSSINISTLAHYAFFDDILDVYVKFGVGEMSASGVGSSGFTMIFGSGIGVRFNNRVSMKIAYDRYQTDYIKATQEREMILDLFYTAFEVQF